MATTTQGTVKTVVADKGFGFISVEGMEKDVFFHINNVSEELAERGIGPGDLVEFEMEETEKGFNAIDLRIAKTEE